MSRSVSTRAHKGDPCAPAIAAFDFDGTLTDRHTLWRYLRLLVGSRRFYGMFAALTPTVCAVIAHKIPVKDGRLRRRAKRGAARAGNRVRGRVVPPLLHACRR